MKIAYLAHSQLPSQTANSVHVMSMCRAFAANGHDASLFVARGDHDADPFEFYGVERCFNIYLASRGKVPRLASVQLTAELVARAALAGPFDVLYSRNPWCALGLLQMGAPVVYEAHSMPDPSSPQGRAEAAIFASRNLARFVVISEGLREDYARFYPGFPAHLAFTAHDGADEPHGATPLEPWPGRPGAFQVGYIGSLYEGRGIDVILATARSLPEVDFHIVGGKPEEVERWRPDAPANTHFHGFVTHGQLGARYARLDAVLSPYQNKVTVAGGKGDTSRWMSPLKIFEYMAWKKAIICSDIPVLREVLAHETNALLVPATEPAAWVAAVDRLSRDRVLAAALAERASRDFLEHFTWKSRAARVLEGL